MTEDQKIIPNYIYFYHLDKFCILPLYPESITDTMGTRFNETNALSRSAPVFTYAYSGPRTVQVDFKLHRDILNDVNKGISNLRDDISIEDWTQKDYVDTLINYLQAAALPKYQVYSSGSKSVEPPMVAVRLSSDVFIRGVITSGITVNHQKPINSDGKFMVVDISFTISEVDPYDAASVVKLGSFRGISSGNSLQK